MSDNGQINRMLRNLPQQLNKKEEEITKPTHIDWQDVSIKYPEVFKDIALRVYNLNYVSRDWLESPTGQRISINKIIGKMNKDMQERAYERLIQFFIHHNIMMPTFPYRRNKRVWYRFELYDLTTLEQEDNFIRCQEGFFDPVSANVAVTKSAIDYLAFKLQ